VKTFAATALVSACCAAAAVALSLWLESSSALFGAALSAASGGLALVLKRRTVLRHGLKAVMGALVAMFFVRGALLGLGLWAVVRGGGNELAFVGGFFFLYAAQQTLELLWVVHASKALNGVPAT
jgi:hypothetical protein